MPFKPAKKTKQDKIKMMLWGPAGGGKTKTAFIFARWLTEQTGLSHFAVIDTEGGRCRKYADEFTFDMQQISSNFTPTRIRELINETVEAGYSVLVIDGITPFWSKDGGVLQQVDRAGGGMKGWQKGTPLQDTLVEAVLDAPIHLICTSRAKLDTVQEETDGKTKIRVVGTAPKQRDDLGYEFDFLCQMQPPNNTMHFDKSMMGQFQDTEVVKPDHRVVEKILDWLQSDAEDAPAAWTYDPDRIAGARRYIKSLNLDEARVNERLGYEWTDSRMDRKEFLAFLDEIAREAQTS